jgi:hypothetical protein
LISKHYRTVIQPERGLILANEKDDALSEAENYLPAESEYFSDERGLENVENVLARAKEYQEAAAGAFAENTERARLADWKIFAAWCDEQQVGSLPATPEIVVGFIDAQAQIKKVATVKRYLTTIANAHKAAGLKNPVRHEFVRLAIRRMCRTYGTRQTQARGFNWPQIYLALQTLDDSPRSKLDKALVCVSYDRMPGLATRRQAKHAIV